MSARWCGCSWTLRWDRCAIPGTATHARIIAHTHARSCSVSRLWIQLHPATCTHARTRKYLNTPLSPETHTRHTRTRTRTRPRCSTSPERVPNAASHTQCHCAHTGARKERRGGEETAKVCGCVESPGEPYGSAELRDTDPGLHCYDHLPLAGCPRSPSPLPFLPPQPQPYSPTQSGTHCQDPAISDTRKHSAVSSG